MGHSQFAELIGARGPNTQVNSACASTTQAVALAEDWIRAGRCRRVVVIAADDVTTDTLLEWVGAGFLASGAAATDEAVEHAALPFDRRRHGMLLGMGAAALVVESAAAARERGLDPICEVLGAVTANSAFHGTRLDVEHIGDVMESLVSGAEARWGIDRRAIAGRTLFVSHETYTPARGGSAAAEVEALRRVFGKTAERIIVANTKGLTGHPMGVGIEDVVAVKALETGLVPAVPNFKEPDPELGYLNLSQGGAYPIDYALRLGAGFGSQISMTLLRWVPTRDGVRRTPEALGYAYRIADAAAWRAWLVRVTGNAQAELEVVSRQLRVTDHGPPARLTATPPLRPAATPPTAATSATRTLVAAVPSVPSASPPSDVPAPLGADGEIASVGGDGKQPAFTPRAVLASSPAPAPAAGVDAVEEQVLTLVEEKTGYPRDMLELDLDLEADLGVDTVKQAEMFAAIRERYGIERDAKLKLRDFPTLRHVIQFVHDRRPGLAATTSGVTAAAAATDVATLEGAGAAGGAGGDPVQEQVLALVEEKTGYPRDMLELDLDLEADLGVDTVKQAEMFAAIRERYGIERDAKLKLRDFPTLRHVIQFVHDRRPGLAATTSGVTAAAATTDVATLEGAGAGAGGDPVQEQVLALVEEKTGYPRDMLELDLDLEADLGVDTVKQAEMFAAIRERYGIERDAKLKLRDFPTLRHVIQFVHDRRPDPASGAISNGSPRPQLSTAPTTGDVSPTSSGGASAIPAASAAAMPIAVRDLADADRLPRRVPVPALRPALGRCKPTGVTLGKGTRVVVAMDRGGVGKALVRRLEKLGVEALVVQDAADAAALVARIERWLADGAIEGVYWLPALDVEPPLAAMDLAAWRTALGLRVKSLAAAMRALYEQVAGTATFLVSATRLGGQHGYGEAGATAPMGGAVTGFTKAYKRERPAALVKSVDVALERKPAEVAQLLIDETLRDPGAVEIGHADGERWTVALVDEPGHSQGSTTLGRDSVFVVTGAAGSIVAAIIADLAAASGGTFHLLDRVPAPDARDPDLVRFTSDRESLKRDIFSRLKARGERATPALVERELAALERAHAAVTAIAAIEAAGGRAHYHSVDLTDADAVAAVIDEVRRHGRLDVLVHAAGLEISHTLPDKSPAEFDRVFDVKSDGWFNLLHAIGDLPVGSTVAFSSIAGRFGNRGQTDYSAANDLLCKSTASFRTVRPATRGIVIDWTAWRDIGMAARGSIPQMMALAGIDMLPPDVGIPAVRRELVAGGRGGEVVIAGSLGVLGEELDETGGVDPNAFAAETRGPMLGRVVGFGVARGLTVETTLDPKRQAFLRDHQIDGVPVLPGVMGIEAFAELAALAAPSWTIDAVENVDFIAPFKFYRGEPRTLTLVALLRPEGAALVGECRLVGARQLAGQAEAQVTTHFTGRVRLVRGAAPSAEMVVPPPSANGHAVDQADVYRVYFHGPAYQVLASVRHHDGGAIGRMAADLPPNHTPGDLPTRMAPRLIELCFQTAGIQQIAATGRLGLPRHVDRVAVRAGSEPPLPLFAVVTAPASGSGRVDARVVDAAGAVHVRLEGYATVELPSPVEQAQQDIMRAAMA